MEIDSTAVGLELPEYSCVVEKRRVMNYAAAIDDPNPRYLDDTRKEGIMAPPLFPVVLTWPVIRTAGDHLTTSIPPQAMMNMVHATEYLEIRRPIRSGMRLTMTSRLAAVVPMRVGSMVVLRVDATTEDGEAVFTEHSGALLRGISCRDEGNGEESLPSLPEIDHAEAPRWSSKLEIPRRAPFLYDGCTDIVFAIHTSRAFAKMVGLPDILLQGTATLAMAVREIVDRELDGGAEQVRTIACQLRAPVIPGSTIDVELLGRRNTSAGTLNAFQVLNAEGQTAIRSGILAFEE